MTFIPKPHEIYKHFKGNLYQIVTIAEHSETGEQLVIYQGLYGEFKTYARPLSSFVSLVDGEKYPEVTQKYRFELQGGDEQRQNEREAGNCGAVEPEAGAGVLCDAAAEAEPQYREAEGTGAEEMPKKEPISEGEAALDPLVLEFLDADSYEERLNILAALHHRITDDMLTTMAIASDVEIDDGDTEERYESLKACLLTLEKYECNRLR